MKPVNYLGNIIAIAVIVGVVFGVIHFKESQSYNYLSYKMGGMTQWVKNFINVRKHNIGMEVTPTRQAPLTFIEREAALELWAPEIFGEFSERDWHFFWSLVYEPISVKEGGFTVKRYRDREEIENILCANFKNLNYLKDPDWSELWGVARVSW
jgi:hypothetical protein